MKTCNTINTFERNKFFYGKLLSVDDFQTEQDYFRKKNRLLNRYLEGSGIVHGLEVSNIETVAEGITLQITAGYALDACGELIVIENNITTTIKTLLTDETLYLYLQYAECDKDRVASISEDSSCEESCCYNRISEIYELKLDHNQSNSNGVLISILRNNESTYVSDTTSCEYIDSNRELAERLFLHENNTDNPHQVSAEQVNAIKSINQIQHPGKDITLTSDGSIDIEADDDTKSIKLSVSETILSELYSDIMEIKSNLDEVLRFLMDKALKYKLKAFSKVLEHFESKSAIEIVKIVQEAIDKRAYINKEEFLSLMEYLTKLETELIDEVKERALEKELALYIVAIEGLKVAMGQKDLFAIAVAQDEVCERAEWLVPQVEKVKVPKITTLQLDKAITTLAQKGLLIGSMTHTVSNKPRNSVLTQSPKANVVVEKGSHVDVTVAIKADKIVVPTVTGLNILNAKNNITYVGLKVGSVTEEISDDVQAGTVLAQQPLPNVKVDPGTAVNLTVAKAQEKTKVPQLINHRDKDAKSILDEYALKLGTVTYSNSSHRQGTILSQTPKAGSLVALESSVSIVVASALKMTSVPNLVGYSTKDAEKVLELVKKAHLQQGNVSYIVSTKPKGTILSQKPVAGAKVVMGSAIDITVAKNRSRFHADPILVTPTPIDPIKPVVRPDIGVNPRINHNPFISPVINSSRDESTIEVPDVIKKTRK